MNEDLNGKVKKGTEIEVPELEALPEIPKGRAAVPLDGYVEEARRGARLVAELSLSRLRPAENAKESNERKQDIESRVELAEKYAIWRWHGFVNGEIVSL